MTLTKSQKLAWQAKDDLILVLEARVEELDERRETAVKLLTRISDSAWEVVERGTIEAFLMREMERAALDKKEAV